MPSVINMCADDVKKKIDGLKTLTREYLQLSMELREQTYDM